MKKIANILISISFMALFSQNAKAAFPVTVDLGSSDDSGKLISVYYASSSTSPYVYLAGETDIGGKPGIFLSKFDENGAEIARSSFTDGAYEYYLSTMTPFIEVSKILIRGSYIYMPAFRHNGTDFDTMIFKYALDLVFKSSAVYDNASNELATSIDADSSGIYVSAITGDGAGTIKYDENLNLIDTSTFTLLTSNYNDSVFRDIDIYNGYLYLSGIVYDGLNYYPMIAKVPTSDLTSISTYVITDVTAPDLFSNARIAHDGDGSIIFSSDYNGTSSIETLISVFDENLKLKRRKTFANPPAALTIKGIRANSGRFSFGVFDLTNNTADFYRLNTQFIMLSSESYVNANIIPQNVHFGNISNKSYFAGIDDSGANFDASLDRKGISVSENLINLTIKKGEDNSNMAQMPVAVIGFNSETMMPDVNITFISETDSNGVLKTYMPSGKEYLVAVSSPNWTPTIRDQMMDPYGNFNIYLDDNQYRDYYLYSMQEQAHTLKVNVLNVSTGDIVMVDVFFSGGNMEMASSGMAISTAANSQIEVYNVPDPYGATYGVRVFKPETNEEYTAFLSNFPTVSSITVDMSSAMPPSMNYETTTSTMPPSYEGYVMDENSDPIANAKITVTKEVWDDLGCDGNPCFKRISTATYETFTDPNGRFTFYDLPAIVNFECDWSLATNGKEHYIAEAKKQGYTYGGDCFMVEPDYSWYSSFQLNPATYTLTGYIQFNGQGVPFARVDVWGDWDPRAGNDSYSSFNPDAGMKSEAHVQTSATGYFEISGLPDGNVRLNTSFWSNWMEFNNGADGQYGGSDDLRITISSAGAQTGTLAAPCDNPGAVWVVDAEAGTCVSTGPVVFNIQTTTSTGGLISGNLTFITTYTVTAAEPLIIDANSPVVVMAIEECHEDCQNQEIAFDSVSGTLTSSTMSYEINLSSNTNYWTKIVSNEWGKYSSFNDMADLGSTDTIKLDFKLVKSGKLEGIIKLPDGKIYKPQWGSISDSHWVDIEIQGVDVDFHEGMGVRDDGTFEYQNLPPGKYNIILKPRGEGFKWPPAMLGGIRINAGKTANAEIRLKEGLVVQPQIVGLPEISTSAWIYTIIPVPSGAKMSRKRINELFYTDMQYEFEYSTETATWNKVYMETGQYDFYLVLGSKYNPFGDEDPVSFTEFATFIGRAKNVSIKKDVSNPSLGTYDNPIPIDIMGQVSQSSKMEGEVTGDNIFTDPDYARIFANFENEIIPLIPTVMLYDSAGELKGFTHAMPDEEAIVGFFNGLIAKDKDIIKSTLTARPLRYYIHGVPPGNYTAVFANPNYPPAAKEISLPEDEVYNLHFDQQNIPVGEISGVVKSSATGQAVGNAKVFLTHRTVEKFSTTDSSGVFVFANLPAGAYNVEVKREGYVPSGLKTSLSGSDSKNFDIYLATSTSYITGKIYLRKYPAPVTQNGIKVIAYNETQNVSNPNLYLAKYEAKTQSDGSYAFYGVLPGSTYYIAAMKEGKLPGTVRVKVSEGQNIAGEIVLVDIPPQLKIKVKKDPEKANKLKLEIRSPQDLLSAPSCTYNPGETYDSTAAVNLALITGPDNTYFGEFTTSISQTQYNIRVTAGNGNNRITKEVVYDTQSDAKTEQYVQQTAIEGGEVSMDEQSEEYTGLGIDTGGMSYSTGTADYSDLVGGFFSALPSVKTVKTEKGKMSLESAIANLMVSEVYNIDLDNASPNKAFSLNLKYDKNKALNAGALKIYQKVGGQWKEVPGNYTVDPMLGVISVEVASIDLAYEGAGDVTTPLARKKYKMSAISPEGTYVPRSGGSSQSGQFAVFSAKPDPNITYSGSTFEVYNLPNPFNLKSKTVTNIEGTAAFGGASSYATEGTLIKYHLPSGKSGNVKFVIYNVAGEKVRTIDDGSRTGGKTYYSEWDGKNDNGEKCASGVYFLLTFVNGDKIGNKAHKMALIK